jgi:hypothetical protein
LAKTTEQRKQAALAIIQQRIVDKERLLASKMHEYDALTSAKIYKLQSIQILLECKDINDHCNKLHWIRIRIERNYDVKHILLELLQDD